MKSASSPPSFDITPFLTRDEGQHYDRKSLYEGPPAHKRARDRRAVRDQVAEYVAAFANGFPLRMADQTVQAAPDQIQALKFTGLAESFEARPSRMSVDQLNAAHIEQAKASAGLKDASIEDYLLRRRLADWRGSTLRLRQAAELLFARDLVEHPNAGVRVFLVVGTERKTGRDHNVEELPRIEGALPDVLSETYSVISGRLRHPSRLGKDAVFHQVSEYPDFASREAILNAVAHRDYGVHGRGVEVWLFDDRMEVTSPGALLPSVSIERLLAGERTHVSRNPRIVRCLVDLDLMRDSGEGILRMHEKMLEQDLPVPRYDTRTHEVWVTLRNRVDADGGELDADRQELDTDRRELDADRRELEPDRRELDADRQELTAVERDLIAKLGARPRMEKLRIVLLVLLKRQPWTNSELARALHRDPENLVRRHLGPMVESGQIKRTRPDAPTDPNQAYYAAEGYWGPVVGGEE